MEPAPVQRKMIIGGNWKCNGTVDFVRTICQNTLNPLEWNNETCEVVVCPLMIHIASAKAMLK